MPWRQDPLLGYSVFKADSIRVSFWISGSRISGTTDYLQKKKIPVCCEYTALQKFGTTLVNWSARGNTATHMSISSRILHGLFQNSV